MPTRITISDIPVDVTFKNIKNVHLSVYPPNGSVRIAAPAYMTIETIRLYAIAKLDWIKRQQQKLQEQERETPREYIDRESHYLWGRRYLLKLVEAEQAPTVEIKHDQIVLTIRPGLETEKRTEIVSAWYREQLRTTMIPLIEKWETTLGVKVGRCFVQRMKTRWGSCSPDHGSIRLNTELAKKPQECLEYVIVHELMHLRIPSHNQAFVSLMDQYMLGWRHFKDELNQAPLAHEDWEY